MTFRGNLTLDGRTAASGLRGRPPGWPGPADVGVPLLLVPPQLGIAALMSLGDDFLVPRDRTGWIALVALVLFMDAALVWRRVRPLPVLMMIVVVGDAGTVMIHAMEVPATDFALWVALFSLAAHSDRRKALLGCAAAYVIHEVAAAFRADGVGDWALDTVVDALMLLALTALGQLRRQRRARRAGLAEQLAAAEREHAAAGAAERERLARDLHDVAGHHLSAVIVHSGAAAAVPDAALAAHALETAAGTGRDVLAALARLVDEVEPEEQAAEGLPGLLPPLCEGIRRLGTPVALDVEGRARRLPPQVVTAAYRIVQESLTNAMRYASGAAVDVAVRYLPGAVEIEVGNGLPAVEGYVPPLGTGRGVAGMRSRAEALGGTLDAGPRAGGGWRVRAVLPTTLADGRRGHGWPEVVDGVLIAQSVLLPAFVAFVPPEQVLPGWSAWSGMLLVAAFVLRALPLWWRRHAPYAVLAWTTGFDVLWSATAGTSRAAMTGLLLIGATTLVSAVYAVAAYARRGVPAWPAPFVAALAWAATLAAMLVRLSGGSMLVPGLLIGYGAGLVCFLPAWIVGKAVVTRGHRWENAALETMAARTGAAVTAERHRVTQGLRGTVLERTARFVRVAEDALADPDADHPAALREVAEHARAALTDMRALLDALRPAPDTEPAST
ncbi:sensor histidine kinase [Actinomadura rupiterrae]|uniref:sensor histidine kinase n=1 Tax=Actinomadura rupiterrae TaxID=559627 RepID=UPI0020A24DE0|nr:histidine kinase [Actinomadura rupiterrae]MCP2340798.1 signal transduction histidine kinase [Actinomadura rupiterrae]